MRILTFYEPTSRLGYLSVGSGLVLGGTLVGAGVLYLMPESVTNWDKKEIYNLGRNWLKKTSRGPVIDGDDWYLNWITHPYWGAVYYMQPRVAGYSWAESALYSTLASALFWEYGIEAFAETPSWQDLVITPAVGSVLGELFYQASMKISQKSKHFAWLKDSLAKLHCFLWILWVLFCRIWALQMPLV